MRTLKKVGNVAWKALRFTLLAVLISPALGVVVAELGIVAMLVAPVAVFGVAMMLPVLLMGWLERRRQRVPHPSTKDYRTVNRVVVSSKDLAEVV